MTGSLKAIFAYHNNSRTEVARGIASYEDTIKAREIVKENIGDHCDVIARLATTDLHQRANRLTGIKVSYRNFGEVIGETKMMVTAFTNPQPYNQSMTLKTNNEDFK